MGKIVTGLLAVSLITSPASDAALTTDAAEPKKAVFSSLCDKDNSEHTIAGIDRMLCTIEKNSKDIKRMLKDKLCAVSKIQTALEVKALTRQSMTEEQIEIYKSFKEDYEKDSTRLYGILETIRLSDGMNDAQKAVFSDDNEIVYNELKTVTGSQTEAIKRLDEMLSSCAATLSRLR